METAPVMQRSILWNSSGSVSISPLRVPFRHRFLPLIDGSIVPICSQCGSLVSRSLCFLSSLLTFLQALTRLYAFLQVLPSHQPHFFTGLAFSQASPSFGPWSFFTTTIFIRSSWDAFLTTKMPQSCWCGPILTEHPSITITIYCRRVLTSSPV